MMQHIETITIKNENGNMVEQKLNERYEPFLLALMGHMNGE